ncbi:MAG: hypothetical protein ACRDSG_00720, partial [Pseudonocardiaceae bacterium]
MSVYPLFRVRADVADIADIVEAPLARLNATVTPRVPPTTYSTGPTPRRPPTARVAVSVSPQA